MTDLTSFQRYIDKLEEIVTAWQIPEPTPTNEARNEAAATTETSPETSTAARLVDLLGW
ncbi:MAG TPA: hypothetical protein VJS45_13585 [Acidimicrobiia bacterium]|nr:hypothetical protein [Acidimicrobiia bacterium]